MEPTDLQLVERINQGDLEAFETLYKRYRDWICSLAFRFTQDRNLSLDVMQEVFVYILKKPPNLRLTGKMQSFLYPVVKNISLEMIRKQRRQILPEECLFEVPAPHQTQTASQQELAIVLGNLPAAQRQVLLMRMVDDLSIDEIAAALSIPPGTVKSRIHNALQTLRQDERTKHYFFG